MWRFLLKILLNVAGIYIASSFVPGFIFKGAYLELAEVAVILTVVNFVFGGLLRFFFRPLIFLTFGILSLIISMATLWVVDLLFTPLTISSITALFLGTLIITVLNLPFIEGYHSKKFR